MRALNKPERGIPMAVGKVSDADFEAEVLKATGPVVSWLRLKLAPLLLNL